VAKRIDHVIRAMRILVVGDDAAFFAEMQGFLAKAGFRNVQGATDLEAASARAALTASSGAPLDLAILDLSRSRAPKGSGSRRRTEEEETLSPGMIRELAEAHRMTVFASGAEPRDDLRLAGVSEFLGEGFIADVRGRNLTLARIERALVERHFALRRAATAEENRRVFLDILQVIARALEARDPYSHSHTENVSLWVRRIAGRIGLDARSQGELARATVLHDIGKIGVREDILLKQGALTAEERAAVERHPLVAVAILEPIEELRGVVAVIQSHHENYDGSGYPGGLSSAAIPFGARIVRVCDAFDAMTSPRPYRPTPLTEEAAAAELRRQAGKQFDPEIVDIFLAELRAEIDRRRRVLSRPSRPASSGTMPAFRPEDVGSG